MGATPPCGSSVTSTGLALAPVKTSRGGHEEQLVFIVPSPSTTFPLPFLPPSFRATMLSSVLAAGLLATSAALAGPIDRPDTAALGAREFVDLTRRSNENVSRSHGDDDWVLEHHLVRPPFTLACCFSSDGHLRISGQPLPLLVASFGVLD